MARQPPTKTSYPALVGWVVMTLRVEKDIKQADFAEKMMVPPSSWSKYESGQTVLTVVQLNHAATLLGLKPQAILDRVEQLRDAITRRGVIVANGLRLPVSDKSKVISGRALGAVITDALLNAPTT
jgi:transcriptional regulator with XRE-family HTH domain